jgi:hypothetical protein
MKKISDEQTQQEQALDEFHRAYRAFIEWLFDPSLGQLVASLEAEQRALALLEAEQPITRSIQ